jgi:phytoene dehydrogenase-like protein
VSTHADGFDAVVVGSGPNGLLGALRLAMAGQRVLVLERAGEVGGALRSEELTLPGFVHDVGATVLPLAQASLAFRALELPEDEVRWAYGAAELAHPLDGDAGAVVMRDLDATAADLGADGSFWRRAVGRAATAGPTLADTLLSPLSPPSPAALLPLARYGVVGGLPASAVARTLLHTERGRALFAGLAAHSVLRLSQLTSSGYGIFMAALAHGVGWPVVEGGSGRLAHALASRLESLGGEIHTSTAVTSLADVPAASIVLLDLGPRQLVALAGDRLPPRYRRRLLRFRYGPGVFKVDYALDGPVPWLDSRAGQAPTVHLGGTFAEIPLSERTVSRGGHPDRPYVIAVQAAVADPSRAPAGKHTLWAYCHVPNGSTADRSSAIGAQLERYAPGWRDLVLARHVLAPDDLEQWDPNLVGGDVGGGAGDLRQFVARPVLSPHPWRTPLDGVYLCSASTPPGGGVHGMGGWHAAGRALRDIGVRDQA